MGLESCVSRQQNCGPQQPLTSYCSAAAAAASDAVRPLPPPPPPPPPPPLPGRRRPAEPGRGTVGPTTLLPPPPLLSFQPGKPPAEGALLPKQPGSAVLRGSSGSGGIAAAAPAAAAVAATVAAAAAAPGSACGCDPGSGLLSCAPEPRGDEAGPAPTAPPRPALACLCAKMPSSPLDTPMYCTVYVMPCGLPYKVLAGRPAV
ncbi:hypothetical protein TSOC_008238 [Tetrabaena socialis]|uniref:Uncharacterized protein n=1 Tax=Tetrabaena socialis TaxID=47790 RepID=A0A2J7ZYZ8_9CHLO|nr:hypothetical protein TSOC_008238 [Tetrabaena socialis]|eukprot:PNH05493.1 hypothetical protein TSOC_008238 [Tetrabaena socialis]